ncbi:MAG TPA: M14 family zinc carboxypeptidase, partial [Williamwhitmania sp.]|nr:M14 family zinc carboxypeptidase [Williamwhitmania sp.]
YTLENQAMMNFANQNRIVLSANFHGGSEVVNYPWDYYTASQRQHPDRQWFIAVSQQFASLVQTYGPVNYFTDVDPSGIIQGADWYPITGGRQDYMTVFHHGREVTIEISSAKTPSSDQLPNYWNYLKRSFFSYMNQVLTGVYGTVKNADGEAVMADIIVASHDKDSSNVWSDSTNGTYYRLIYPGTYTFTYSATGYDTYQQSITINSITDRVEQNIVLTKSTATIGNNDSSQNKLSANLGSNGTTVMFTTNKFTTGQLNIYSISGKLLGSNTVSIQPGVNQWPLEQCVSSGNSLAAGIYLASLTIKGIQYSAKIPVIIN